MTTRVGNPFPLFIGRDGLPITGGAIYVGTEGADPELSPLPVYIDEALTVLAPQPLAVIGGLACYDGNPLTFYVASDNYSMRVRDADNSEVFYLARAVIDANDWQPRDSDLTAIAALSTTEFGRALLQMADPAALRTYAGIAESLPLAGGIVTGNITRAAAGSHLYHAGTYASGRVFVTGAGASDPTSLEGDIWLELAP